MVKELILRYVVICEVYIRARILLFRAKYSFSYERANSQSVTDYQ